MEDQKTLFTVGQIAEILQEPPGRIAYVIGKFRIKPTERIGIIRRFAPEQIENIKQGLYNLHVRGRA